MAEPRAVFDRLIPSSGDGFISANFRNNYNALYQMDFLPWRPRAHGSQASLADSGIMVLGIDDAGYRSPVTIQSTVINIASGDVTGFTPFPSVNPRIDLVYVSGDGTKRITKGVEAVSPVAPKVSGDLIPICQVYQKTTASKILNYEDKDTDTDQSYILKDVRPSFAPYGTAAGLGSVNVGSKVSGDLLKYDGINWVNIPKIRLDSQVQANLPTTNLNSGTSASGSTFWCGDGTWTQAAQYTDTRFAVGSFTRDTSLASGTQAVTGLGFTPKAIIFLANESGTAEMSWGLDNGTAVVVLDEKSTAGLYSNTTAYSIFVEQTDGVQYLGKVDSFDSGGFTITWTRVGAPTGTLTVFYMAYR